eukprot:TRINITY_DN14899_c0_g1_i1.p1 TRINITY_DN14899_c0_g1~~TRINITY_DN14899_c0_g1_i1.p1  ORF type:complete len:141 (-),score=1.07 TRINITY_DN14899_c0_g1_i1:77-499(-)
MSQHNATIEQPQTGRLTSRSRMQVTAALHITATTGARLATNVLNELTAKKGTPRHHVSLSWSSLTARRWACGRSPAQTQCLKALSARPATAADSRFLSARVRDACAESTAKLVTPQRRARDNIGFPTGVSLMAVPQRCSL